ncbi:MAG: choice-of-anchor B family protein [Saprospiraceae bacterium]|nr:choice-of-anchor B family protein [Saprospiraceae bacterium]
MKDLIFSALFCVLSTILCAQNNFNLELLARWDDDSLPIASPGNLKLQYNSCWGLAVNGHEYAVIGGAAHVLFFDVTEPTQPKLVGKFQGRATVVPREFKSYKNRVYAVADGANDGLMIFDLSHAEDTIIRTYWDTTFFKKIHTIALDTTSGRIYMNGGNANQGIIVLDASQNPDSPTFLAHPDLPGGYVHDCYVRNDTVYVSSGNEGYYIFDFKDPQNPVLLAQISTGGYNHNSWLTLDGKYAYYAEEIPQGRPMHIVDLQNLALGEIEVVGSFLDNILEPAADVKLAIPHNLYIKGDLLYDSQYEDGLLVYDISDRLHPTLIAHYDTRPENTNYNGYFGNWGNYPWLPSGTIISSDMQNGLFLFRPVTVNIVTPEPALTASIYPNPTSDFLAFRVGGTEKCSWQMLDISGRLIQQGVTTPDQETRIQVQSESNGFYFLKITSPSGKSTVKKVVVQE